MSTPARHSCRSASRRQIFVEKPFAAPNFVEEVPPLDEGLFD